MSVELIVWLVVGTAAGDFINGLAGFGTALMSLGVWLQVMPPWQAVRSWPQCRLQAAFRASGLSAGGLKKARGFLTRCRLSRNRQGF